MSGVEVIGLLASLSQLAVHSKNIYASISEIYHRIEDAPKRIQEHAQQLGQLIDTAVLIKKHALLQTDNIKIHIVSTLDQARLLSAKLDKVKGDYLSGPSIKRYWKIIKGERERAILSSLERLEQEKGALLLSISIAHTDLLGNIKGHLDSPPSRASAVMPQRKLQSTIGVRVACYHPHHLLTSKLYLPFS